MPVKRFLIQGIVQGVGFRYFARREARGLGLAGYVRNLADSSVEAVARGDEESLAALEAALRRGPRGSRVDSVDVEDLPGEFFQDDFIIR
jgi:acylphosphatase